MQFQKTRLAMENTSVWFVNIDLLQIHDFNNDAVSSR